MVTTVPFSRSKESVSLSIAQIYLILVVCIIIHARPLNHFIGFASSKRTVSDNAYPDSDSFSASLGGIVNPNSVSQIPENMTSSPYLEAYLLDRDVS